MNGINKTTEYLDAAGAKINQAVDSIFKIATGALALSITFRNSLADNNPKYIWMLSLAWILLGLVPISYVLLRLSEAHQDLFWWQKHVEAEKAFKEGKEVKPMNELPIELKIKLWMAKFYYYTLFSSFVLGIIAFLLFAILNNTNLR